MKVMAILNITPDSFSDGGKYINIDIALNEVENMLKSGVDIIDIGGESTRPSSEPVSVDEEIKRVIPVIEKISEKFPEAVLSIDTYKSKVAKLAIELGVKIVNDISALTFDPKMIEVLKENKNVKVVLMHIQGTPKTMQLNPYYINATLDIYNWLKDRTEIAINNGIGRDNIIIDPGIGFGKNLEDNLDILKNIKKFKEMNFPVLIGLSRKSFLGKILDLDVDKRDIATIIAETYSVLQGADIIRTHNYNNALQMKKLLSLL